MKVLIITDKAKTIGQNSKTNSVLDSYSGTFKQIRTFYTKLTEVDAQPEIKIILPNGKILDSKNSVNSVPKANVKDLIQNLNKYDFIILLLDKCTLEYFNEIFLSSNSKYSNRMFISAPESVKQEIFDIFKDAKVKFYNRVGVARIGKKQAQEIVDVIKKDGKHNG